jgi:amidase
LARSVRDVALMLGAISGPDPRSPVAIAEPGDVYLKPLQRDFPGVRVAWSRDLGVLCPWTRA